MTAVAPQRRAFEALGVRGYRMYLATFMLTMMADNIEHVISYWVAFQKFHSAALGGFAVVSHWLPYLLFSVAVGALNDRFDSRRLIQAGAVLFMAVSLGWGYFFVTGTLQMWHAMVLLVLHGCAGVLWITSSQVLLYDIVGPAALPSAVRLNATARYLGMLVGPGVGSLIMLTLGPIARHLRQRALLPAALALADRARPTAATSAGDRGRPQARGARAAPTSCRRSARFAACPVLGAMVLLAGAASFFVGNSYQAQMPGFAQDLGHGDPGAAYTLLLGADAAGALVAGFLLESARRAAAHHAARSAMKLAHAVGGGAVRLRLRAHLYAGPAAAVRGGLLRAVVQQHGADAGADERAGRHRAGACSGLFNMSSAGLRTFSGVTVGLAGSLVTVHASLAASAGAFLVATGVGLTRRRRPADL